VALGGRRTRETKEGESKEGRGGIPPRKLKNEYRIVPKDGFSGSIVAPKQRQTAQHVGRGMVQRKIRLRVGTP
jgi:hypothetical protein